MNDRFVIERPYERAGVVTPGLPALSPGVERYPVPGGGSSTMQMRSTSVVRFEC